MNKQRRKVLVLQHPDGYLQVYADKDIDVRVLSLFDEIHYDMGTEDEQIESLPLCFRYLHRADRIRATAMMRKPPKKRPSLWEFIKAFDYHANQIEKRNKQDAQEACESKRTPESSRAAIKAACTRPAAPPKPGTPCPTT